MVTHSDWYDQTWSSLIPWHTCLSQTIFPLFLPFPPHSPPHSPPFPSHLPSPTTTGIQSSLARTGWRNASHLKWYELYNPDNQLDKPNSCRALQYFSIDKWQIKNLREKFKEFGDHLQLDGLAAGPSRTNLSQGMEGWTGSRRSKRRNLRSNDWWLIWTWRTSFFDFCQKRTKKKNCPGHPYMCFDCIKPLRLTII